MTPVMHRCHYRIWRCASLSLVRKGTLSALLQSSRAVYTRSSSPLREHFNLRQNPNPDETHVELQPQRQSRLYRGAKKVLLGTRDREAGLSQKNPLSPLTADRHDDVTSAVHEKKPGGRIDRGKTPTARSRVTSPSSTTPLRLFVGERDSPYASTVRKRVVPRHTGTHGAIEDFNSAYQSDDQRRDAADLRFEETRSTERDGYDPALVVHVDSSRRQVRLNDVQRELLWTARQKQYHNLLQRIVACLQSHRSPIEKCQTLLSLHDEAIEKHLRLRADTYEDIFHTLYSVGVRRGGGAGQPGKASLSSSADLFGGGAGCEKNCLPQETSPVSSGGAVPAELLAPSAASSTVLSPHGMENVWEMYRYLVDSGTDPTPRILQYMMGLLEHASVSLAVARSHIVSSSGDSPSAHRRHRARSSSLLLVEAKAHSLMMDADRFHLTPSEYTINSYIAICETCDVMHLAVARVADYQTRQERQASPGMYARLLTGLVRCGHYTDAMAVVTTMQNVALTTYLVNAVLQAARHSRDPASVFTFYRSLFFTSSPLHISNDRHHERSDAAGKAARLGRLNRTSRPSTGLVPSLVTFSIMAEVMLETQDYTELTFVMTEMRHYGVKGNGRFLNKLLRMMHMAGRPQSELHALRHAMDAKQVRVFDENKTGGEGVSSLAQGMQWGEVEQVQLQRFLEGFTSPDPVVQTSNLEQLQALSQYPSSLVSTLAIVGDAAASVTVRLSATTVARQLLRCTDRLPLYLSAAGDDPTRAVQSIVEALLDAALGGLHSPSSATTTTPLQRATGGLIACLLSALAHTSLVTTATSVLSNLISFLLHRTDPATLIMHDVHEERRLHIVQCWSRCSTLLREICEGPLSTSKVLREWVGGQESQSLALCSLFSQLLQLLEEQMGMEWAASGAAARLSALWLEDTLTAFQTCIDSGVLPCGASYLLNAPTSDCLTTSSAADRSSTGLGDGPSAQALRTVCAAVHRVQSSAQGLILRRVLGTLAYSTDERTDGPLLRERVVVTAPFVALSMRYMADAVALETIEALHDVFHTAATPLLASFCRAVRRAQLQYDGAGEPDSAHAAVLACIHYITEWLHAESTRLRTPSIRPAGYPAHPSMTSAPTVDCASCLYSMLIDAATLPTSIAEALEEHTTVRADSASDLLARSVAGRRRGPRSHRTQEACDGQVCISAEPPKENRNSVTALKEAQRDKQDAVVLADMLEIELPDNGTLRQAVAWCAVALSCHQMWMMAVAPLVVRFTATPLQGNLAAACAMESTLFVSNELLDSVIADDKVSASIAASTPQLPEQNLVSHALCVLSLLSPRTEDGAGTRPPFFVCIQAVRYIGRLLVGFLDAWEYTLGAGHANQSSFRLLERTRTVMAPTGGLDRLLGLVLGRLTTENSKATQVECVKTLDAALTSCLKVMEHLVRSPMNGGDKSDLEEESLDSTSCLSGDTSAGDGEEDEAGHPLGDEPFERARVFCQSFGITPDLRIVADVLHLVSSHLPSFQWSVREAVYHLLSQVLPLLWRTAPLVDSLFPKRTDGTGLEAAAASSARIVTVHALEAMAQHYSTLLSASSVSDNASPMLEMATLLMSMADVTSAMDGGTLGVVVPWILQVAHHMLSVYARFLTSRAYSDHSPMADRSGEIVNMTDMCMVSLDLVSCVCDGVIDRDALLEQQLRPDGAGEAFRTMDARLMALAESLLLPIATSGIKGDGTPSSDSGCEALPNRCMALLGVCQSLSDHPTNASTESNSVSANGAVADEASYPLDEFGEVRRACFAIVYDCIFLAAYPSSLFRPLDVAVAPSTGSVSGPICLSDSLGRDLFALCMREVLPCTNSSLPNRHTQFMEHPRCISAHNVAASDAWLCLGSLLSLWDQQHWRTRFTAPNGVRLTCEGESGPRSVFYMCEPESLIELHSHCLLTLNGLLSRLQDKSATIASSMRLNMTTAACGLALLLCCNPGHSHTSPGVRAPLCPLSFANISAVFSVTSSNRIQSYAADASSGDLTGINEAAHVLWCLGRLWQEAVQPLPHDALCAFLRSHGREIAKTISWWTRCVFGAKKQVPPAEPSALVSHTFWESLLELWRPVAHTLVQATQENALSLAKAQLSTLGRLVQL